MKQNKRRTNRSSFFYTFIYASKKLKIPMEKFFVNIEKYGNTSAASVPIALAELHASGKLKRGDIVALCAFGGGLSSAACIIKW